MRMLATAAALTMLAACGGEPRDGGVTAEEAQKLNEAEEMLDASPDSLVAADGTLLGNGEASADTGDGMTANRN